MLLTGLKTSMVSTQRLVNRTFQTVDKRGRNSTQQKRLFLFSSYIFCFLVSFSDFKRTSSTADLSAITPLASVLSHVPQHLQPTIILISWAPSQEGGKH